MKALISAVILGAGRSSRFGEPKQLLDAGRGKNVLEVVVAKFAASKVDETIVVLGYDAEAVVRKSDFGGARIVVNQEFDEGLGSSLRKGIEAVHPRSEAALVALGDQPLVSSSTIAKMLEKYIETREPIVAPYYHRRRGNPVLFSRSLFDELRKVQGDKGAKEVVERNAGMVARVQVEDLGVLFDIDTEEDYARFRKTLDRGFRRERP